MKKITTDQIKGVLQVIYQTNISARNFDELATLFNKLPDIEVTSETK